jgi:tetratricopeptide (TPR) repeat protein
MKLKNIQLYTLYVITILLSSCSVTQESTGFIPGNNCKDCEEFVSKISIVKNDSNFIHNSNFCFDYFITKGDSCLKIKHFKRQDFQESIYFYKKGLEIDSTNQEAAFKIAYLYDLLDSINEAQYYYNKITQKYLNLKNRYNNKEFAEIDVEKIKKNFQYNDSILPQFIKFGKKSSITFDFINSFTTFDGFLDNLLYKNIYLKIYGNGEFETRGYFDVNTSSKINFQGKQPDSLFIAILELLEDVRFLSFQNLFKFDDDEGSSYFNYDSRFGIIVPATGPWNLFRITINTHDFSNSISIRGLSDEKGPWSGFTNNFPLITLDNVKSSPIGLKLCMLSKLWICTFDYNLLKYKKE